MEVDFAKRDLNLSQIQQEIKSKKSLLISKKKNLEDKLQMNEYLSDVKDDYEKYYSYILKEKQQQYDALVLLKEYIDDLAHTENMVDEQLDVAKHDQHDIVKEIDKVKKELDELTA